MTNVSLSACTHSGLTLCITNVNADPTNTVPFLEKALSLVLCATEHAGVLLGLTKLQAPWSDAKLTKF